MFYPHATLNCSAENTSNKNTDMAPLTTLDLIFEVVHLKVHFKNARCNGMTEKENARCKCRFSTPF